MARVLVVDDDPDVLSLFAHRLTRLGHAVSTASDGIAGLAAIGAHRPDLVLLDWMMPGMTGPEVCAAARADPANGGVRILLVTARTQDGDVEAALAAGADGHLAKPFTSAELSARVAALLPTD